MWFSISYLVSWCDLYVLYKEISAHKKEQKRKIVSIYLDEIDIATFFINFKGEHHRLLEAGRIPSEGYEEYGPSALFGESGFSLTPEENYLLGSLEIYPLYTHRRCVDEEILDPSPIEGMVLYLNNVYTTFFNALPMKVDFKKYFKKFNFKIEHRYSSEDLEFLEVNNLDGNPLIRWPYFVEFAQGSSLMFSNESSQNSVYNSFIKGSQSWGTYYIPSEFYEKEVLGDHSFPADMMLFRDLDLEYYTNDINIIINYFLNYYYQQEGYLEYRVSGFSLDSASVSREVANDFLKPPVPLFLCEGSHFSSRCLMYGSPSAKVVPHFFAMGSFMTEPEKLIHLYELPTEIEAEGEAVYSLLDMDLAMRMQSFFFFKNSIQHFSFNNKFSLKLYSYRKRGRANNKAFKFNLNSNKNLFDNRARFKERFSFFLDEKILIKNRK